VRPLNERSGFDPGPPAVIRPLPTIRGYLPAKKVRHQKPQLVSLTLCRAVLDGHVLALDIASLFMP
jgi:hypothetical protein